MRKVLIDILTVLRKQLILSWVEYIWQPDSWIYLWWRPNFDKYQIKFHEIRMDQTQYNIRLGKSTLKILNFKKYFQSVNFYPTKKENNKFSQLD